jgi:hypothetical protein
MSSRTKAERALDDQNRLLAKLEDAQDMMRKQNRAVSASSSTLRRLIVAERKRLDVVRRELDRQRGKPGR